MADTINQIYTAVLDGDAKVVQAGVTAALDAGIAPEKILRNGLIDAMGEVGRLSEEAEQSSSISGARHLKGDCWKAFSRPMVALYSASPFMMNHCRIRCLWRRNGMEEIGRAVEGKQAGMGASRPCLFLAGYDQRRSALAWCGSTVATFRPA